MSITRWIKEKNNGVEERKLEPERLIFDNWDERKVTETDQTVVTWQDIRKIDEEESSGQTPGKKSRKNLSIGTK